MLGFEVAQSTVSKYIARPKLVDLFLRNHAEGIAAIDMCVVPTLTFDLLFAFLVIGHGQQQLLWFEVTRHPTAEWLARRSPEPLSLDVSAAYLVRDNDPAGYLPGPGGGRWVSAIDRISPQSQWRNKIRNV